MEWKLYYKFTGRIKLILCIFLFSNGLCYANSAEYYYRQGNHFYDIKDYELAIENYNKSLAHKTRLIGAFNNLANIYFYEKKDYNKAEQICLEGLSYYPFEDSLILIMMYIDFEFGRVDKGMAKYIALSNQKLSHTLIFPTERFESAIKKKDFSPERVIKIYNSLLEVNPEDHALVLKVAEHLKDSGNYQKALDKYKEAIELNPEMGIAYVGMGTCYYNLGKDKLALKYFKKAEKAGQYIPKEFFGILKNTTLP